MTNISEKTKSHALEAEKSWGDSYGRFSKILQSRNLKVGVEIGVAFGGHSESILKCPVVNKLYGVDPYKNDPNYIDPMNLPQEEFDDLFHFTVNRLSKYGDRYEHIRMPSQSAVNNISGLVDFVYIDADHSYEGVFRDLCTWFVKIREGGVIGGHDYGHKDIKGVTQAVNEFFGRFGWTVQTEGGTVWWVEKKPISISFIVPAFNCEKTLEETVESVMHGNFVPGDEIVIVNDASTDNTEKVIESLKHKYSQIISVNQKYNRGGGATRNTAVENTKNQLVFCVDSDNILVSGSVLRLKDYLISNGAQAACFTELKYFNENTTNISHSWIFEHKKFSIIEQLSEIIIPGASGNYLFTIESWKRAGGYPEFAGALDTWGFGLRQHATGTDIYVLPDSFYFHRIGIESYWVRDSRKGGMEIKKIQLLLPYLDLLKSTDIAYLLKEIQKDDVNIDFSKRPIHLRSGINVHAGISSEITQSTTENKAENAVIYKIWNRLIRLFKKMKLHLGCG